jgi:predicted MPP superfamily phosphohydrolase
MVGLPFQAIALGSSLVDLAVAVAIVRRPGRGERSLEPSCQPGISASRLAFAWFAAGGSLLAKAAALIPLGLTPFGIVHLVYLFLVLTVPLIGAITLATEATNRANGRGLGLTLPARTLAVLSLLGAPVGCYATFVEPFQFRVERATLALPAWRQGSDTIRVGILTDLQTSHVTEYEHAAVERLLAQRPGLILIPGDVFQGDDAAFERELPALRALLARLEAPGGVFVVAGDTDQAPGRMARLVAGSRIRWLDFGLATVEVGDRRVTIGGVGLDFASDAARRVVSVLEADPDPGDVRILLTHRPDAVRQLRPHSRIDLVVAGHTHGGQIVVPGFGPPLTLTRVPRAVAAGGLHRLEGNAIYVSRGVGCERGQAPRIRLFCPPEISLLSLSKPELPAPAPAPVTFGRSSQAPGPSTRPS